MPRLSTGLLIAGSLAAVVTAVIAWPVVLNPSQLIYGHEIVGRQPDPYTVISLFGGTPGSGPQTQPLTSVAGRWLGLLLPQVAAFNLLMLLAFPFTAMTTYALARYLTGSHGAGLISALGFTFAPSHLAHAAYHPFLTQTQWIPLFVLALIALVDRMSVGRVAGLAVAGAGLALSNNDAAFLGAVLAPVILVAFWTIRADADRNVRPLIGPALALALVVAAGAAAVWTWHPELLTGAGRIESPIDDVAFYRARWWAYLTPAVDHPLLGGLARQLFGAKAVTLQLTEQQLFVGFSMLTLAAAGLVMASFRWSSDVRWRALPALCAVGLVALLLSLGPVSGSCEPASMAPGCLLFGIAPWFRAYARFGILVQLMLALAAGAGAVLLARRSRRGRLAATALLAVAAFEYWPMPARAHDVLPTAAHRAMVSMSPGSRTLDCYPGSATQVAIPQIMRREVSFLDQAIKTCGDPLIGVRLAALGFTHLLMRRSPAASKLPAPLPAGISLANAFSDSGLYTVSATPPRVMAFPADGFFGYEHSGDDWWQWMGPQGQWTVRNTTSTPQRVWLALDLVSVGSPRGLRATLDGAPAGVLSVGISRRDYRLGPWTLGPGTHTLSFLAEGDPLRPSDVETSDDRRSLTIAFRNDRWIDSP